MDTQRIQKFKVIFAYVPFLLPMSGRWSASSLSESQTKIGVWPSCKSINETPIDDWQCLFANTNLRLCEPRCFDNACSQFGGTSAKSFLYAGRSHPWTNASLGETFAELSELLVHTDFPWKQGTKRLVHTDLPWNLYGPMAPKSLWKFWSTVLGILSGLHIMENGWKAGNGEEMENQMENGPELDRGKNGQDLTDKWIFEGIFHFFLHFRAMFWPFLPLSSSGPFSIWFLQSQIRVPTEFRIASSPYRVQNTSRPKIPKNYRKNVTKSPPRARAKGVSRTLENCVFLPSKCLLESPFLEPLLRTRLSNRFPLRAGATGSQVYTGIGP